MADPDKKVTSLDRLKAVLQETSGETMEGSQATMSQSGDEEIDQLITRLKQKTAAEKLATPTASAKTYEIIEAAGGVVKTPEEALDFQRVGGELTKQGSLLASIYQRFEGPLQRIVVALSEMPFSKGLRDDLLSAGMTYNPETYLALVTTASLIIFFITTFGIGTLAAAYGDVLLASTAPIMGVMGFLIAVFAGIKIPSMRGAERGRQVERELPFALRQLSSQIKAGVSLNRAIASVARAEYGLLSDEFKRMMRDLERGQRTEDAIGGLSQRVASKGLRRSISQLLRALRTGGRVSDIISSIAEDVSFDMRMRIRDYTETLNLLSIIYVMVAIVAPVATTLLSAIVQLPMLRGAFPPEFTIYIFTGIGMAMGAMLFVTIRLEPGS